MSRILALTVFLLKDFSRSLRVVVPPGLLLALYRVFFLYGSDVRYFGTVGAIMLGCICVATTLLIISSANRASTFPLIARLPSRSDLIWAAVLSSLGITLLMAVALVLFVVVGHAVPLRPLDLISIAPRWLALFLFLIAMSLHLSKLVTRFGANLAAYLLLILALVSYQRIEYPSLPGLDQAENAISFLLQPITSLIGGAELASARGFLSAFFITLIYSLLLFLLAAWLFRRKDLLWAE